MGALALLAAGALSHGAVFLVPDPTWACAAALLLTVAVPGALLAMLVVPTEGTEPAEWLLTALGLGLTTLVASGLILAYLPVRLGPTALLAWFDGLTVLLAAGILRFRPDWRLPRPTARAALPDLALIIGLGAVLRLPNLGYSELQGDETKVVLPALGVLQDAPDALFYHGKGPAEVLVTAVHYGLVGTLSEASARLPFALASVAGLAGIYFVSRRLLGRPGALAAALLLALNGYLIAFARLAQYQSLVFLLTVLAIWCAVRHADSQARGSSPGPAADPGAGPRNSPAWPILAGAFAATAALAHYDAVFSLPPIALLAVWARGPRGLLERRVLLGWLAAGAVGLALLLLFFGPYLLSPLFELAEDRIERRVGVGLHNNLGAMWASATFYTSAVYPILVLALVGLGTAMAVLGHRTLAGYTPMRQHRPAPDGHPPITAWTVALVWFAVPLLFYVFIAEDPGTHFHVAATGLALMGGWTISALWSTLRDRAWRLATAGLLGAAFALVGAYLIPLYLLTTPGPMRDALRYLSLAGMVADESEVKGKFGFPYQAGWKAVGQLYEEGRLAGTFDSNARPQVAHWYTRGVWRCAANPRYYFVAEGTEEEIEPRGGRVVARYPIAGIVTVGGQPRLRVHEYGALLGVEPEVWPAEAFAERFDRHLSGSALDPGVWGRGPIPTSYTPTQAKFGDAVRLLGYRLSRENQRPGGTVHLELYWMPLISSAGGHSLDLQLGADRSIGDGSDPACDRRSPTTREWTAGSPFAERAILAIAADAPPGRHPILVGISQPAAGHRLRPATTLPTRAGLVELDYVEVGAER